MEKEFIPYEEALALKELGFDEPCFGFFKTNKEFEQYHTFYKGKFFGCTNKILSRMLDGENVNSKVLSPTFSQAFRWFRDNHNLHGQVNIRTWFIYETSNGNLTMVDLYDKLNNSHEESELVCLKGLIQIVKNK